MPENNTADILEQTEYLVVHYEIVTDSKPKFKPIHAASIGGLTPQELEVFMKENNDVLEFTEDNKNVYLVTQNGLKKNTINFLSPKNQYFLLPQTIAYDKNEGIKGIKGIEHIEAIKKYEEACKKGKPFFDSVCKRLENCAKSADVIRIHMRKLPLTSSVPNDSSPGHQRVPLQMGRDEWIDSICRKNKCGLKVGVDEWNKLSEEVRKKIDKKKYTPTNPNTVTKSISRSRKKKIRKIVK